MHFHPLQLYPEHLLLYPSLTLSWKSTDEAVCIGHLDHPRTNENPTNEKMGKLFLLSQKLFAEESEIPLHITVETIILY